MTGRNPAAIAPRTGAIMKFEIQYYRDVWTDDNVQRRATYKAEDGECVSLLRLVKRFAYFTSTYAVMWLGDTVVGRFTLDAESQRWKQQVN
jgi:hypothetical protein